MSHANATFMTRCGTMLFGEYNGTSDVMLTNMFHTHEEAIENWRKQEWRECECGQTKVTECVAHSDYGGGYWWKGTCCLQCNTFLGPLDPYGDDVCMTDGDLPNPNQVQWNFGQLHTQHQKAIE